MSSTRYRKPGSPPKQERFASSYERGLMGNLVAKRCGLLGSPVDRELAWFVQWLSWQPSGLSALAIDGAERFCLDPHSSLTDQNREALVAFRRDWVSLRAACTVTTAIGKQIEEALDYTRSARTISIIDGPARIGKTYAARSWCDRSAGLARYCQVPSSSDDWSFLRAIARALGVSINLNSKAVELRARVEETLHCGDLMLVLDEAAYLFPQVWQRCAVTARVEWIMSALASFEVPVALISAPHFYQAQQKVEKLTGWNSAQFLGRIGHVERLPDHLEPADLVKVAEALLPEGDLAVYTKLAIYAGISKRHLASIEAIVKRARWLASRGGRQVATPADVDRAINESVIPSDSALAVALKQTRRGDLADAPPTTHGGCVVDFDPIARRGSPHEVT